MYPDIETEISYKYLQKLIKILEEPICMIGGWAVYFHVQDEFKKAQDRPYLGSRDIDLGFHFDKKLTFKEIKNSAFVKTIDILEKDLHFEAVNFRFVKEIHSETGKEIPKNINLPQHFIFPIYVDLIIDNIPKKFKEAVKLNPIDEPLLHYVFEDKKYRSTKETLHKKLLLPSVSLMVAMKLKSLPNRDKSHKRIKDICDLFALMWYGGENISKIKDDLTSLVKREDIEKALVCLEKDSLEIVSVAIGHSVEEIEELLKSLLS